MKTLRSLTLLVFSILFLSCQNEEIIPLDEKQPMTPIEKIEDDNLVSSKTAEQVGSTFRRIGSKQTRTYSNNACLQLCK